MKQLILGIVPAAIAVALGLVAAMAGPASAGGWAVSTLDAVPVPAAGETVDIGFTIRQHGVTPVNPDGAVGIVFRSATDGERFFAAEPAGAVGHYIAEVTFPDEGTWSWSVRQGWFAEQELGVVELAPRTDAVVAAGYRWPAWIRFGLPVLALALAAGALLDQRRDRRQRPQIVAA